VLRLIDAASQETLNVLFYAARTQNNNKNNVNNTIPVYLHAQLLAWKPSTELANERIPWPLAR
jgi:hypothetical protein